MSTHDQRRTGPPMPAPLAEQAVDRLNRLAYSPAEAAELLGLSRQAIYNLIASGELRSVKIRKSRRIPRSEVVRLSNEGSRETA